MKKETGKKSKLWLWIVIAVAAVAIIGGVVAAFVLPGMFQQKAPTGPVPEEKLYWNVDRKLWLEEETSMSLRTPGEDGYYHLNYLVDGEIVDIKVAQKQLVNYLDAQDLLCLAFDENGICVDAAPFDTYFQEAGKDLYVKRFQNGTLELNSSIGMDGMNMMYPIPEGFKICEVSDGSEQKGSAVTPDWLDACSVYTDMEGNLVAIYVTGHNAIDAEIAWAINTMNSRGYHTSPDENGVYTMQYAINGEIVDRKCKDWTLVQQLETLSSYDCSLALEYDEEGYIIDYESVQMALRGIKLYDQAVVTSVVDGHVTGNTIQGVPVDFTYDENTVIYNVCNGNCFKKNEGERVSEIFVGDRLHVYTDLDGKVNLVFKCVSRMDSPMYYRLNKTTDEDGYFVYDFAVDGKVKQYRTKDEKLAAKIDGYFDKATALELKGSIIKNAGGSVCVCGDGRATNGGFIMTVQQPVLTYFNTSDPTKMNAALMNADCEIYLVDDHYKTKIGSRTELKEYDRILAFRNPNKELTQVYVLQRYRPGHKLAVNLKRQYSANETTRVPDAEGYYVFDVVSEGKQMQVKTKDKAMASFIDKQNYPFFGFKANKNGVLSSVCSAESVFPYAMKTNNFNRVDTTENGLLETWYSNSGLDKVIAGNKFAISSKTKVYNMDAASVEKYVGEKTKLRKYDHVQALLKADTGEQAYVFVMDRPLAVTKLYANAASVPPIDNVPNRTPDKDGYYNLKMYSDGKTITVRVKDAALCAKIDAAGNSVPFGLTFKKGTNIVEAYYATGDTQYFQTMGPADVKGFEDDKVILSYPGQEKEYTATIADAEIIDLRSGSKTIGKNVKLKKGDRVRYYNDGESAYVFIMSKPRTSGLDTLKLDAKGYGECPSCGKVKWTAFDGTKAFGTWQEPVTEHLHLYLPSDVTYTSSISGNMVVISGEGGLCFHLNGYKLNMSNSRIWMTGSLDENAVFNLYGGNGDIEFEKSSPVQQNRGTLNIVGGTYTPSGSYVNFIDCATRTVAIKDATIHSSLKSQSTATHFVLQGSTTVHKVNLDIGGRLELDSSWTGTAILDMDASELTDGKVSTGKVFYTGDAPTGKLTLATGEELQYKNGGLEIKYPEELKLDAKGQAECTVCKKTVKWEKFDGTTQLADITTHRHFYLAQDTEYTVGNTNLMTLVAGGKVCLHLNSYALIAKDGQFNLTDDAAVLNIITNNGKIYYNNATALINQGKGKVVVTGGSYIAENTTAPFISANGSVVLKNAIVKADIVSQSDATVIELQGAAKVNKIDLDNGGKIKLNSNWTGSALLDMKASELTGGKVPADKVSYSGKAPTGRLKLATGEILTYKNNGLVIDTSIKDVLIVDDDGYGVCPACEENVKWIAFDGTTQYSNIDTHQHIYLAEDSVYTFNSFNMMQVGAGGSLCFHLNGHTLDIGREEGARIWMTGSVDENAVLNIFGTKGKINYRSYPIIQQNRGHVNIYGGTYTGTNIENFVETATRNFLIKDATIDGNLNSLSGATRFILEGTTKVGKINLNGGGVLELKSNWTGTATLDMTAEDMGSDPAPAMYTGDAPTGTVKLTSGESLIYKDGKLVLATPVVPPRVAECPACGEVEWSKFNGAKQYTNITTHVHYYLDKDTDYTFNSFNMIQLAAGGSVCLDLNGKTLNIARNEGARIWLPAGAGEGAVLNIFANGGTITYPNYPLIQQNVGTVNIYGGTYTGRNTDSFIDVATRAINIQDATISGNIISLSGATHITLKGSTTIGKINLNGGGKLELKSDWTGSAILDMDALELTTGKVPTNKVYYTGAAPTGTVTLSSGETLSYEDGALVLDGFVPVLPPEETFDKECPACGEVEWTKYDGTKQYTGISDHQHFYLAADTTYSFNSINLLTVAAGGNVCFDLNGKTLTIDRAEGARFWIGSGASGAVVNIFANGGAINFTDNRIFQVNAGTMNVYGGTYTTTGTNKVFAELTGGTLLLKDVNANGEIKNASWTSVCKLEGTTTLSKINLSYTSSSGSRLFGKLELNSNWTGTATTDFTAADFTDGVLSKGIAYYTGTAPTGTLKLATGEQLYYADGALVLDANAQPDPEPEQPPVPEDLLVVDENGYGECPVCGNVQWTVYEGTKQYTDITTHQHFYLTEDTSYTFGSVNLITVGAGGSVCFHLNGKTLTIDRTGGARFWLTGGASESAVLNMFGTDGGINYKDYPIIQQNKGYVNIYGGTYTGTNVEKFVDCATRNFTIEDAVISGNLRSQSSATRFILKGATTVGKLDISGGGKVELDASWTGSAVLDMTAASLTAGKVPADKVFYTGETATTGTVTLASGETLIYKNNGLEIGVPSSVPADAQAKIDAAAVIAAKDPAAVIAGNTCPMCGATNVTWKKQSGRVDYTEGQVAHVYFEGEMTQNSWGTMLLYNINNNNPANNVKICAVLVDANITSYGPFIAAGSSANSVINVMGNGTVNVTGTKASGSDGVIYAMGSTTINLYGGTYSFSGTWAKYEDAVAVIRGNSVLNIYNNTILGNATQDKNTNSLVLSVIDGTVNMYGGTIRNGVNTKDSSVEGGNVVIRDAAVFNMYAGTIENGYSAYRGGNVYSCGFNGGKIATFNMYGGTVTGGVAVRGANIAMDAGYVTIYDGTISNGGDASTTYGESFYLATANTTSTISGGTVSGGTSANGVNVYVFRGDVQITGGTVEGTVVVSTTATIQDATIDGEIDLNSGNSVLTLKGAANISGNINFKETYNTSKVIVDASFTGAATLNPKDGMYLNGVFGETRGEATGNFTGLVKVVNGEAFDTLVNDGGKLVKASA